MECDHPVLILRPLMVNSLYMTMSVAATKCDAILPHMSDPTEKDGEVRNKCISIR